MSLLKCKILDKLFWVVCWCLPFLSLSEGGRGRHPPLFRCAISSCLLYKMAESWTKMSKNRVANGPQMQSESYRNKYTWEKILPTERGSHMLAHSSASPADNRLSTRNYLDNFILSFGILKTVRKSINYYCSEIFYCQF